MPADDPRREQRRALVTKARQAVTVLRDAARVGNVIEFRQRDTLVMAIHNALDEVEALEALGVAAEAARLTEIEEEKMQPNAAEKQSVDGPHSVSARLHLPLMSLRLALMTFNERNAGGIIRTNVPHIKELLDAVTAVVMADDDLLNTGVSDANASDLESRGFKTSGQSVAATEVDPVGVSAARRREEEWQDISTAPKDGTDIALWNPQWTEARVGRWFEPMANRRGWWAANTAPVEPTHWLRIPSPPCGANK